MYVLTHTLYVLIISVVLLVVPALSIEMIPTSPVTMYAHKIHLHTCHTVHYTLLYTCTYIDNYQCST